MKKVLELIVAIIIAIVVLGGVTFLIDCSSIKSGKKPIIAVSVSQWDDGGTTEYMGLGYRIIDFNMLNGYDDIKIGSWFMRAEDFKVEYEKYNNIEIIKPAEDENLEDMISDNISGDVSISGEDIVIENVSGDMESSDNEIINTVSGDEENIEIVSGDSIIDVSGDTEIKEENENIFNAVIIGINNNNIIVQALQNESINSSADMFSFSLNESNNSNAIEFLVGQKVKIEYTGTIAETYPAQIDVITIEIVE